MDLDRRLVGVIVGLLIFLGVFSFYAYVIAASEEELDPTILALRDRDAETRAAAAVTLGAQQRWAAVPALIQGLDDEKEAPPKAAFARALHRITGKDFGEDAGAWRDAWESGTLAAAAPRQTRRGGTEGLSTQILVAYLGIVACMVLLVMLAIVFSAMASSRIKEMKELIRRVQEYITTMEGVARKGEEVKAAIDAERKQATQAIEAARQEGIAVLRNNTEEEQADQTRYVEIMQREMQHWAREMIMDLRQKAEKEIIAQSAQARAEEIRDLKKSALEAQKQMQAEFRAHAHWLAAQRHAGRGRPAAALREIQAFLAVVPSDPAGLVLLGTSLRHLGRLEEALEASGKALAAAPNDPEALYLRAAVLATLKRREEMLATLGQAVAADGEYKDEALNDAAFRDYWQDPQFKDVAES
ncbi:MAG: hypothetical protein HYY93_02050 [Planctomycetes bacterium]|nr:hypothetical protein [Planctomycetota bacterium]